MHWPDGHEKKILAATETMGTNLFFLFFSNQLFELTHVLQGLPNLWYVSGLRHPKGQFATDNRETQIRKTQTMSDKSLIKSS